MKRSPYRPRLVPDWLQDTLAVAGLLAIIAGFFVLSIYGYMLQEGLAP